MANPTGKASRKEEENPNTKPGFAASVNGADLPDFDKWSDDQIGFAPYWHPDANDLSKFFFGTPIARDERNPKFIRFLFISAMDGLVCQRGPNAAVAEAKGRDVEYVTVNKGDTFSLSVYKGPEDIFNEYLEYQQENPNDPLLIRIQAKEKIVQNNPEKPFFWTWHPVKMEPEQKKRLQTWRMTRNTKRKALVSAPTRPGLES